MIVGNLSLINVDGKLWDYVSEEYIKSLKNTYPSDTTHFTPSFHLGMAYFFKIDKSYKPLIYSQETKAWLPYKEDFFSKSFKHNLIEIKQLNSYLNYKPNIDITDYDQWGAWRIGRDCNDGSYSQEQAINRLKSIFPQPSLEPYFQAGFLGNECPELTAKRTE
jgi:hypothetical protein